MSKLYITAGVLCAILAAPAAWSQTADQAADMARMKAQMEAQQKQIDDLKAALEAQKKLLEKVEAAPATTAETTPAPEAQSKPANLGDVASTTPILPAAPAVSKALPISFVPQAALPGTSQAVPESPLQIHVGGATITPVGFIDATNTFRSTNSGANLATNFGNIPYNNNAASRLTEDKFSLQNSRLGLRVDALFKGIHVLGYYEGDFVGAVAANNTAVTSNSMLYRLRLFWVDLRKNKFEFLAGQSWSMLTPNRYQISALPGDLFYGQQFDVNYLNGLTWGRIPGVRFLYHPSNKVTMGISLENSDQYFGGSGGAGVPTLPSALSTLTSTQIDSNSVVDYNLPNVAPDVIAKIAFDPSRRVHFEVAGVMSNFKTFNPNTLQYFTKTSGGGSINANVEVVKGLRLITNNFWSDGEGRFMFGQAPDFIIRSNGSISPIHSGSTVDGFEATIGKLQVYGYYGGIFIGRNTALDTNGSLIGYGFKGSANSQNKTTQEATFGITQTFWKDPKYGAVSMYLDWAYFFRNPWYVGSGPKSAHQNAAWFDLRYTLPGGAPNIEY